MDGENAGEATVPGHEFAALRERELLELERLGPGAKAPQTRAVIRASWLRSAQRGLRVGELNVPSTSAFDADSVLVRYARPVLDVLRSSLADEPVSIMLCDETGLVLSRDCNDRTILRSLDDVALAPGSTYSESTVGTNGFGLALADDRSALVTGDEHFCSKLSGYTCAGSPIHDPATGVLLGALSLTTWSVERSGLLLALAEQTALNIETQLASRTRRFRTEDAPPSRLTRFEAIERGAILVALDRADGIVADAADELGISRATIYRRIKRYGIRSFRSAGDREQEGNHQGGSQGEHAPEAATPLTLAN